ncbi:hypothetical protein EB796_002111 [Bugula neritina]|uniref:Uncharacterized protein n=1 Tax=Bugula neritina TaxID=10212 RepID=A0A7J7KN54_BUGNE|nr:hypothetical protein EB796_002111 [Bugula neritina]
MHYAPYETIPNCSQSWPSSRMCLENMVDDVSLKLSSPEVGVHSPTCNFMVTEKEPDFDGQETIDYGGREKTKDWSDPGNQ